jgi:folate-binding protein YgfZ
MTTLHSPPPATLPDGVTRLSHWGVIRIQGEDAAKFIHGQLTQDFALLGTDQARFAAFCNAKGRMQASFVGYKTVQGDVFLLCSRDLLAATLKRLSMFVLRAKAKLSDATESFAVWGLSGSAIKNIAGGAYSAWAKAENEGETIVQLYPAGSIPRQLCITAVDAPQPAGAALDLEVWRWGDVSSGVATLSAPVFEAFVPQMLNYESIGGVSFKKGCYPGQEVVARSQFRGTLKRRAFIAHSEWAMEAGQEVFSADDPDQSVGTVVQAAAHPNGGFDAIISLQLAAQNSLLLVFGKALHLLPLPYALLEDI